MSAAESEWEFGVVEDPEDVRAPRADHHVPAHERVKEYAYMSGAFELRTAESDDSWMTCRNPADLSEME